MRRRTDPRLHRVIAETVGNGLCVVDAHAVISFVNQPMADLLGRSRAELPGTSFAALLDAEGKLLAAETLVLVSEGRPTRTDLRIELPTGTSVWLLWSAAPFFTRGAYAGAVGVFTDITERRRAEMDARRMLDGLVEAQALARLGSWALDISSGVITCSDQLAELLDLDPVSGLPDLDTFLGLVHPDDRPRGEALLQRVLAGRGPSSEQLRILTPAGNERSLDLRAEPVVEGSGMVTSVRGTMQEISERAASEEQLAHLALHDKLTGLPNRSLFADRLHHARSRRAGAVTVMLIDLDGFKAINDDLGHAAGDSLLVTTAHRLSSALRPSDTIARFGGDEFTVLLEDASSAAAMEAGERLLDALAPPVELEGHQVSVRASIGIAVGAVDTETADELFRQADTAMYAAKRTGGGRSALFSPHMLAAGLERQALESELRAADPGAEMVLQYQPLVDLRDGQLRGCEALLRWDHPTRGRLLPEDFLSVADDTGAIVPLGRWVLNAACRQVTAWHRRHPRSPPLTMNVNVSARQLAEPDFVADVACALELSSLAPERLTLEIAETMLMADEDAVCAHLAELRGLGVRISVDNVGTIYSSVGHFARFPVDELKIDRSFVAGLGRGSQDSGVAVGLILLARSLHLDVVAEGIENVDQLVELRRSGCPRGQGWFLYSPMDAAGIEALLDEGSTYLMPELPRLVLVVDDDEDVRVSLGRVLRAVGYDVIEAENGAEALRIVEETRLDAVILDVVLPDMDGFEISRRLGEMSQGDLPILHLSGVSVGVDDRVRGLDLGAAAYLTKPVAPAELVAVLGALLRNRASSHRHA